VTLCDPIWHVSSYSSAVLVTQTAMRFLTLPHKYSLLGDVAVLGAIIRLLQAVVLVGTH